MMVSRSVSTICIVFSLSILTGCGAGGPSISESQKALDKFPGAGMMSMAVKSIENCEEIRDHVYGCDIEVSSEILGVKQTKAANMEFKKSDDGQWIILG